MKTYNAIYNPILNKGVYGISLVENPAMEGLVIALNKHTEIQLKEVDKEQRILMGLVLEPNKPIYRNQNGEEFNIVFNEETIKDLSYGFFKNNKQSNSTIEHNDSQKIEGVTFTESWIVEDAKIDKSANFGFNYPKGSWMAVMKVDNEEVWNDYVKTGKIKGFSIDAMLSLEEINLKSDINMSEQAKTNSLLEKILLAFTPKEIELKLGSIALADGSLMIEFEGEMLEVGISCWITAEDGTRVPVPVGEHPLEDGTVLVVTQEGIVGEVLPGVSPEEAPAEVEATDEGKVSNDAQIAQEIESAIKSILIKYSEIEKTVIELKAENEKLKGEFLELSKQPASKPVKGTVVQMATKGKFSDLLNKLNNNN